MVTVTNFLSFFNSHSSFHLLPQASEKDQGTIIMQINSSSFQSLLREHPPTPFPHQHHPPLYHCSAFTEHSELRLLSFTQLVPWGNSFKPHHLTLCEDNKSERTVDNSQHKFHCNKMIYRNSELLQHFFFSNLCKSAPKLACCFYWCLVTEGGIWSVPVWIIFPQILLNIP